MLCWHRHWTTEGEIEHKNRMAVDFFWFLKHDRSQAANDPGQSPYSTAHLPSDTQQIPRHNLHIPT